MNDDNILIVCRHQNDSIDSNESVTPNQSINEISSILKLTITLDSKNSDVFVKVLSIITDFLTKISAQIYAGFSA
jgi:hypothetical protein